MSFASCVRSHAQLYRSKILAVHTSSSQHTSINSSKCVVKPVNVRILQTCFHSAILPRRSYASLSENTQPTANVKNTGPVNKLQSSPAQPAHKLSQSSSSKPTQFGSKTFAGTHGVAPPTPVEGGRVYPERLLVYNAGLGRTIFISAVKLTAIFIFLFSSVLVAPAYYYSPLEPTWMAGAVLVGGAVPLIVMVFTTPPFVTYVHLALPSWARASYPRLVRYTRNLPGSASIDVTTLRWIWPRVTRLSAQELHIHRTQIGAMTLRRTVPQEVLDNMKWYSWRPLRKFYVAGSSGKAAAEKGIWEEIVAAIARGWGKRSLNASQSTKAGNNLNEAKAP